MAQTPDELLNPEEELEQIQRIVALYASGVLAIMAAQKNINPLNPDRFIYEREVRDITAKLETETLRWIEESYPEMYVESSITARGYIKRNLKDIPLNIPFDDIDRLTVQTMSNTSMNLYSDALAATRKKASALMDSITQERIQAELLKLSNQAITPKELASNVRELVENSGVGSLTDRGGKTWQLDTYANMVARTEYAHIVNEATKVQSLKEGYDLVVFTRHGATDSCALLEGVVVSLTGLTPGYQKLDSAIMGTHMLAPNCRHTYTPVSPADAKSLAS